MTADQLKILESRLQRLVELRWQREVIARWIATAKTTDESQSQLREMLAQISVELQVLEGGPSAGECDADTKQAD